MEAANIGDTKVKYVVVRTLHSSPSYASDGELHKLCKPHTSYASYASYLKKVLKSV